MTQNLKRLAVRDGVHLVRKPRQASNGNASGSPTRGPQQEAMSAIEKACGGDASGIWRSWQSPMPVVSVRKMTALTRSEKRRSSFLVNAQNAGLYVRAPWNLGLNKIRNKWTRKSQPACQIL